MSKFKNEPVLSNNNISGTFSKKVTETSIPFFSSFYNNFFVNTFFIDFYSLCFSYLWLWKRLSYQLSCRHIFRVQFLCHVPSWLLVSRKIM